MYVVLFVFRRRLPPNRCRRAAPPLFCRCRYNVQIWVRVGVYSCRAWPQCGGEAGTKCPSAASSPLLGNSRLKTNKPKTECSSQFVQQQCTIASKTLHTYESIPGTRQDQHLVTCILCSTAAVTHHYYNSSGGYFCLYIRSACSQTTYSHCCCTLHCTWTLGKERVNYQLRVREQY